MIQMSASEIKLRNKLAGQTVGQLKAVVAALGNDLSDEAIIVHAFALEELERKMPEADYTSYLLKQLEA